MFEQVEMQHSGGRRPLERFVDLHAVGRGSFAVAVLCLRKEDDALVIRKDILKPLQEGGEKETAEVAGAIKEVAILKRLSHRNVIRILESFTTLQETGARTLHIVLEFANGGSLSEYLKQASGRHLPEDTVLSLFLQLCLAMNYIHANGVMHRDVKPANILLTGSGQRLLKICDFGIAKIVLAGEKFASTIVGTPYYLAPELCEGTIYSNKADMWSCGCVLWEMCTLKRPFVAGNMPALVMAIVKGHRSGDLSSLPYSDVVRVLIDELLDHDPSSRASARQLVDSKELATIHERWSASVDGIERESIELARRLSAEAKEGTKGIDNLGGDSTATDGDTYDDYYTLDRERLQAFPRLWKTGSGQKFPVLLHEFLDLNVIDEDMYGSELTGGCYGGVITSAGHLWIWGRSNAGCCGLGTGVVLQSEEESVRSTFARELNTITRVEVDAILTRFSAGEYHCAALDEDGCVYTWGDMRHGVAGLGLESCASSMENGNARTEEEVKPRGNPFCRGEESESDSNTDSDYEEQHDVALFGSFALPQSQLAGMALSPKDNGGDATFSASRVTSAKGERDSVLQSTSLSFASGGKQSHYDGITQACFVLQPLRIGAMSGVRAVNVCCGQHFTLLLDVQGRVWSWGSGDDGRLGRGDDEDADCPRVVTIAGAQRISAIAAGSEHCLALCGETHKLYSWGGFREGQLGLGSISAIAEEEEQSWEPQQVEGSWEASSPLFKVGAREMQSFAIGRDGCLFLWGNNRYGQSEACSSLRYKSRPKRRGGGLRKASSSASGKSNLRAQSREPKARVRVVSPERATFFSEQSLSVCLCSCSGEHTVVCTEDGSIWSWGRSDDGRLGHSSSSPCCRQPRAFVVSRSAGSVLAAGSSAAAAAAAAAPSSSGLRNRPLPCSVVACLDRTYIKTRNLAGE